MEFGLASSGHDTKKGERGVYVGEALSPVTTKLADHIYAWEFIEISELLPKFWTQKVTRRREVSVQEIHENFPLHEIYPPKDDVNVHDRAVITIMKPARKTTG